MPPPGQAYRCHVCRLELIFDAHARRMIVAPYESDHQPHPAFDRRRRTLIQMPPQVKSDRRRGRRRRSDVA